MQTPEKRRSLRTISLLGALALLASASIEPGRADEIPWVKSPIEARQLAKSTNRLVLLHFSAPSCFPCQRLEKVVYQRPGVGRAIAANYVPVKINAETQVGIRLQYNVTSWPTDVIIDPEGRVISKQSCPIHPAQYLAGLDRVATTNTRMASAYDSLNRSQTTAPPNRPSYPGGSPLSGNATRTKVETPQARPPVSVRSAGQQAAASSPANAGLSDYYRDRYGRPRPAGAVNQNPISDPAKAPVRPRPTLPGGAFAASPGTQSRNAAADSTTPGYARPSRSTIPATAVPNHAVPNHAVPNHAVPNHAVPNHAVPNRSPPVIARRPAQGPASAPAQTRAKPPISLDGMCPVTLVEQEDWVAGDRRWGVVHRGQIYLFVGPEQQKRFLAQPDHYSPVLSGYDPVLAFDRGQYVLGRREHGIYYKNRVFLFRSEESLAQFQRGLARYLDQVRQAENPTRPPL